MILLLLAVQSTKGMLYAWIKSRSLWVIEVLVTTLMVAGRKAQAIGYALV
jgi:hypothetical protein